MNDPSDDVFYTPSIDWDPFDDEVRTLVLLVYSAADEGISKLCGPHVDLNTNPEAQMEIDLWLEEVSAMKRHAGNMALVSLVTLLHDWLAGKSKKSRWKQQFQDLEERLGTGSLSLSSLEELVDARNSIIHHSGAPTFEWKGKRTVHQRFLDRDEPYKEERISVSQTVLNEEVEKVRQHIKQWILKLNASKPAPN